MKARDIIFLAQSFYNEWGTSDPLVIAKELGIQVLMRDECFQGFKAQTIKVDGYPTIISINNRYSDISKRVLCAHELGHALLHSETVNHFDTTRKNSFTNVEYEANLFAVALLCDENSFNIPLEKMNNALLKSVLEYNIYE